MAVGSICVGDNSVGVGSDATKGTDSQQLSFTTDLEIQHSMFVLVIRTNHQFSNSFFPKTLKISPCFTEVSDGKRKSGPLRQFAVAFISADGSQTVSVG